MSDFRVIILCLVVTIAVVKIWNRWKKPTDLPAPKAVDPPVIEKCPHCQSDREPGFLECWNCGKKFEDDQDATTPSD